MGMEDTVPELISLQVVHPLPVWVSVLKLDSQFEQVKQAVVPGWPPIPSGPGSNFPQVSLF